MGERRSSIHSDVLTDNDEDDKLLITPSNLDPQIDSGTGINAVDEYKSEADPLLSEIGVEPSTGAAFLCSNMFARHSVAIWAFFGFFCLYAMRVNLSVAIVAMVAPESTLNHSVQSCPATTKNSTGPPTKYEFDWSPTIQGLVLGAFFYGYITVQLIGGNIAEKFGAKWIFGGGILIAGILSLVAPWAARTHVGLLIAVRFLTGVVCGPGFPSAAALWGKWIPPHEISTIPPASQSGTSIGIITTTPLVSIMIEENFLGGWPSAFYVFGGVSCLWFVGWLFFGFNSPDQHPRISKEERIFLKRHISHMRKERKTPWKKILSCGPLYGIALMHVCNNFIYYTLLTSLPTYFATILNFNLHQNGFLFALPYLAQFLMTVICGPLVDRIRARRIMSTTVLRKIQTIIGTTGTCIFLVAIGFMGCNHVSAVACCILSVGFLGLHTCGALISHLDIAPNYAGTMVGITNSLATIPGFVGPYVVGAITNKNQTLEAWRLIFNISAGIGAFGCLAYCLLFNAEEQPWNRTPEERARNHSNEVTDP